MGTSFVSGIEMALVLATAVTISLAGMWLTRRFAAPAALPHASAPPARSAPASGTGASITRHRARSSRRSLAGSGARSGARDAASRLARLRRAAATSVARAYDAIPTRRRTVEVRTTDVRKSASHQALSAASGRVAITAPPPRLSIEAQFERTERTVTRALLGAHTMRAAQAAASEKLDAAHYALDKLLGELDGIMSLKPAVAEVALFPLSGGSITASRSGASRARVAA